MSEIILPTITLKTAILAREKGFAEKTSKYVIAYSEGDYTYGTCNKETNFNEQGGSSYGDKIYSVPTQALLQEWLREKHKIHIAVDGLYRKNVMVAYTYDICQQGKNPYTEGIHSVQTFPTYKEAMEDALQAALRKL